jgi:hypothetical protein
MPGTKRSGRHPVPVGLHQLRGTLRPDRQRVAGTSRPDAEAGATAAERPSTLSVRAAVVWDQLSASVHVSMADAAAFAVLCELQATFDHLVAQKQASADPPLRLLKAERDAAAALRPFFVMFGLSPVDRVPSAVPAVRSKWGDLLR